MGSLATNLGGAAVFEGRGERLLSAAVGSRGDRCRAGDRAWEEGPLRRTSREAGLLGKPGVSCSQDRGTEPACLKVARQGHTVDGDAGRRRALGDPTLDSGPSSDLHCQGPCVSVGGQVSSARVDSLVGVAMTSVWPSVKREWWALSHGSRPERAALGRLTHLGARLIPAEGPGTGPGSGPLQVGWGFGRLGDPVFHYLLESALTR